MSEEEQKIAAEIAGQFGDDLGAIEARPFAEQLPRGRYTFEITNAYLGRSQASNRKQLVAVTTVRETNAGDELVGKSFSKVWGLETQENMEWFQRDLLALDLQPLSKKEDLLRITQELMGICFQADLVDNKDGNFPPNCYLNRGARRLDLESPGASKPAF